MSFAVCTVLLPDEGVRAMGRLHWAIYLRAWLLFAVSAIAGGAAFLYLHYWFGGRGQQEIPAYGVGGKASRLCSCSRRSFAWQNATGLLADERRSRQRTGGISLKEGFIRRRTMEMNLSKVETVDVIQGIFGRVFDYGSIVIWRRRLQLRANLRMVANPLALRTAIIAQADSTDGRWIADGCGQRLNFNSVKIEGRALFFPVFLARIVRTDYYVNLIRPDHKKLTLGSFGAGRKQPVLKLDRLFGPIGIT